ncbi:ATP-binding protein [Collibacillus ludicampi]|nr:ATP-binding protein [Collibacillus ludicampi]
MLDGKLNRITLQKRNEPVFKTRIYITSHSKDPFRREITLRSLANAFSELSGDNELRRINFRNPARLISKLNKWEIPRMDFDNNIMSASEIGKFIQLPTASLQEEYADYMRTIEHRETDLPERLLTGGIKIGTITIRGTQKEIYFPLSDYDELCLPRIAIGAMGTGKTRGFGANLAVESVRNGFTAITIDVAKDELGDEVESGCKRLGKGDKVIRIKFGNTPIGLDWCEALGSRHAVNRFAAEVLNFFQLHGHEAGLETARYIRLAAKTVATGDGKLSNVIRLFTNDKYRQSEMKRLQRLGKTDLVEQWESYEALSTGMKGKVTEPVMNRLDMLVGDDYLNECLQCDTGIDFREWLNDGYAICCYVPKDELGSEATDIIVSILIAKVWLATLARQGEDAKPAFLVMDEPHQFMSSAKHWKSMVVESRKWRLGLTWLFHSWEQIPRDLAEIIKSAGPHYHIYTSSKKTYRDLAEEIAPFTVEEALKTPRFHAINIIRSGGVTVTPFMAKMTPPPSKCLKSGI